MKIDFTWTNYAACRGMPTEMFFPDDKDGTVSPRVQQVCSGCPVSGPCEDHALKHELAGYWNGTSANSRKARRRALGITVVRLPSGDEWGEAG